MVMVVGMVWVVDTVVDGTMAVVVLVMVDMVDTVYGDMVMADTVDGVMVMEVTVDGDMAVVVGEEEEEDGVDMVDMDGQVLMAMAWVDGVVIMVMDWDTED